MAGIAERLWTRIAAQDRLDALEEAGEGETLRERLRADPAALAAMVDDAVGALLATLADGAERAALRRAVTAGGPVSDALTRAGLAVTSWTGEDARVTAAGRRVVETLDAVSAEVARLLAERLEDGRDR